MEEEIYYRGGRGEEMKLDPASLNLDELPFVLAAAGWMALVGYPEDEGGEVTVRLLDLGGVSTSPNPEHLVSLFQRSGVSRWAHA